MTGHMAAIIEIRVSDRNSYVPGCFFTLVSVRATAKTATITVRTGTTQAGPSFAQAYEQRFCRRGRTQRAAILAARAQAIIACHGEHAVDLILAAVDEALASVVPARRANIDSRTYGTELQKKKMQGTR